jgi:glycosyltransferase involved in cell wall biosynthesis
MIYFDVTKTGKAGHRSGLTRVSARLREELGASAIGVEWRDGYWKNADAGSAVPFSSHDWLLTAELFSEAERPGLWSFLKERPCRLAAIFPDAIPLKQPHISWPQSVTRHPEYMKMLASFDRIFAISAASAEELTGFWTWQGVSPRASVETLLLGADFLKRPRPPFVPANERSAQGGNGSLLCIGILEPRKNQLFLLDVCASLWAEGLAFELNIVGRVNPHFGKPVLARIEALRRAGARAKHHQALSDEKVLELYRAATASVFPTIAEGCGLPPLESLWLGVPCICSDLPVLRENVDGGGCVPVALNDLQAWKAAIRRVLTDAEWAARLRSEAEARVVPTWAQAAAHLRTLETA